MTWNHGRHIINQYPLLPIRISLNLGSIIRSQFLAQTLDASGKFKKLLITNKVVAHLLNSLTSFISCTTKSNLTADTGLKSLVLLILLSSIQIIINQSFAAGQLMITPTRVVFEGSDRSAQVNVVNTGNATETYRIAFVEKRMTENGDFEAIKTPKHDDKLASNMIRFSPRQVILPPGKSQTIRLMLRRPKNIQDGEYRSHLYFQVIPKNASNDIDKLLNENNTQVKIELTPIVGITIPIIVRHGETNVSATLENPQLIQPSQRDSRTLLSLQINRTGNQSVYGDLTIKLFNQGNETILGRANGIAVYIPNSHRNVQLPLNLDPETTINNGKIVITFRERPDNGGAILAKSELQLP